MTDIAKNPAAGEASNRIRPLSDLTDDQAESVLSVETG